MKKILSLCLAALMIFSVLPAAFAAEEVETIENIEETSEYAEAIKFLNTLDVYNGKGNGDLAAEEGVERWQAARFIYRVATGDVAETDVKTTTNYTTFKDIDIGDFDGSSAETLGAIAWAAQAKITNGTSADEFSPTDGIIYQDAITMLVRLLGERYTAASYPYGFITTARELGITDGITGIGLEDEITRGVFAQLLYNAMFADVDGVSLSEKVFGIEKDVVLLTATKNVAYSDSSKVVRDGMVRFAELDAQGEPYGAGYHAAFEEFGLADLAAANAAVGTSYVVYHKNNYEDILSAEALWTVYENRGYDNMTVTGAKYLTLKIDGQSYRVVSEYDELNNKQGWDGDAAGTDQVKLYQAYGKTATVWNTKYILADDGNVYTIGANGLPQIYAYYSAIVDAYFAIQADGTWAKLDLSSILYTEGTVSDTSIGFNKLTANSLFNTTFHSAYADYIVSDSSMDGYADRVTVKQYSFGKIAFDSRKKDTSTAQACFNLTKMAYTDYDVTWADESTVVVTDCTDYGKSTGTEWVRSDEYRWTGDITSNKITSGSKYVLYYVDAANKEIDIIDIFADSADADNYIVSGYVRNVNVTSNQIVLDNGTVYTYGYDNLAGSPLKTKDYYGTSAGDSFKKSNYNLVNNVETIQPMLNTYVTLYVIDGIVVYVEDAAESKNFVILDSFVSFDDDAIVAKAYTTVSNEYTEIKIKAFNGWTVGGFDYYLYFLSNLIGNKNYADVLPFDLYELYQVVSVDADGYYNLTMPSTITDHDKLAVNEYGYITGTDGGGENFGAQYFTPSTTSDYWLILDPDWTETTVNNEIVYVKGDEPRVYAYAGKLNPVQLADIDIYKAAKTDDYVLVAGPATDLTKIDGLFGGSISFVVYNADVAQYDNSNWLNSVNPYEYQFLMTDVLTGATVPVKMDPNLVQKGWAGLEKAINSLLESNIYKIIDGTLYAAKDGTIAPSDWNDVMSYYKEAAGYLDGGVLKLAGSSRQTFRSEVGKKIIAEIFPSWDVEDYATQDAKLIETYRDKVTLFAIDPEAKNAVNVFYKGYLTSKDTIVNAYVDDAAYIYNVYYVIKEDGTAIAWAEKTEDAATLTAESEEAVTVLSVADGATSGQDTNRKATAAASLNQITGELTVTVTLNDVIDIVAGKTVATISPDAKVKAEAAIADTATTLKSFSCTYENFGKLPTTIYVRITRDGTNQLYVAIPVK